MATRKRVWCHCVDVEKAGSGDFKGMTESGCHVGDAVAGCDAVYHVDCAFLAD